MEMRKMPNRDAVERCTEQTEGTGLRGDCKGKCTSRIFLHEHQARATRAPNYWYENYCKECEIAYTKLDRNLVPVLVCSCCKRKLRNKSPYAEAHTPGHP